MQRADQCRHLLTLWALHEFTSTLYKAHTRCNLDVLPRNPSTRRRMERFLTRQARNFTLSCFRRSSVNQRVNGFLNHRFSLHYDDCPERESEGILVFSLALSLSLSNTHTHAHSRLSNTPSGLSLSARAIDLVQPIKDSA